MLLVATWFPLPGLGSFVQWLYQVIGANSWLYDSYQALRRGGVRTLAWIAAAVLLPPAFGVSLLRLGWPWWVRQGLAMVALAAILWLLVLWADRTGRGLGRVRSPSLPQQVRRLSMVPALSWTPLPRYPGEGRGPQRPLVFVSTYNEGGAGYVGGFVENMRDSLRGPWGRAPGFPSTGDGFRPFIEFVSRTAHPIDHSYVAYPTFSVTDVRAALQLERGVRSLRDSLASGEQLSRARFNQFLARNRLSLGSLPALDPSIYSELWTADRTQTASRDRTTTILVSVLPFDRGDRWCKALKVAGAIHQLPGGSPETNGIAAYRRSPFNRVSGTHVARLLVVDRWWEPPFNVQRPQIHIQTEDGLPQPRYAWLLMSAQFDTTRPAVEGVRHWLADLHRVLGPEVVNAIWGPAASLWNANARRARFRRHPPLDVENAADFAELVVAGRHEPLVQVIDHEENTVWDVMRALDTHRRVSQYLVANPNPDEAALRRLVDLYLLPFRGRPGRP